MLCRLFPEQCLGVLKYLLLEHFFAGVTGYKLVDFNMADLDAELLALAGGDDSSDEEVSMPSNTKPASPTPPSPSDEQQHNSEEPSAEMARKGVARPTKRTKKGKKNVARDRER